MIMRYSQIIGIITVIGLVILCFMPWIYIPTKAITVTGLNSEGTNFGKPGLFTIIFSSLSLICFALPIILLKRINVFVAAINLGWNIRNYILLSSCFMGECPEKFIALYLIILLSFIILVMTLLGPAKPIKQ